MIKNKTDYFYYLECDRVALKEKNTRPPFLKPCEIWRYERTLRRLEYYCNCKPKSLIKKYLVYKMHRLSIRYGFFIPINVFGPGLSIAHIGSIHINYKSQVGNNCRIQTGVTLGATNGSSAAPKLGNNIFLGEGCKIIGDITIADDVQIGANAVVVKSILEPGTTWGGVPAKKISNNSSSLNLIKATEIVDVLKQR